MDKVSIMIMSNNNHELLKECVDRVEATTKDLPHDLIIVDDASEPPYKSEDYANAVIVRMPRRSNCCNLRNVGMEMSKTELVFWLDNDTMVDEGWWQPMLAKMTPEVGLVGQPKDARMVRKPFLPLTQAECMVEYQFAFDYNHLNGECDFIVTYCVLVRKSAYRPIFSYGIPTPTVDPETGLSVKSNGFKVVVTDDNLPIYHVGSQTVRPFGMNYHYLLSRVFTKWFKFWEPLNLFELYQDHPVEYDFNASEPQRNGRRGNTDDRDKDYDEIPKEYEYNEN